MSTTKRYRMHGDNFEMTAEIDHTVMTEDKLHEINQFWSGADFRLYDADGSVLHAVLGLLFCRVQLLIVQDDFGVNVNGVTKAFAWKDARGEYKNGQEGWPDMDGSYGIKIISVSEVDLDERPTIDEVQA